MALSSSICPGLARSGEEIGVVGEDFPDVDLRHVEGGLDPSRLGLDEEVAGGPERLPGHRGQRAYNLEGEGLDALEEPSPERDDQAAIVERPVALAGLEAERAGESVEVVVFECQ